MKRRKFLKGVGFAAPSLALTGNRFTASGGTAYHYPTASTLQELTDDLGRLALYLRFNGPLTEVKQAWENVQVSAGSVADRKEYHFATGDTLYLDATTDPTLPTEMVTVTWLDTFTPDTKVTIGGASFSLQDLLTNEQWQSTADGAPQVTAFLLGHHEIGTVQPREFLGQSPPAAGTPYTFAIMADPQGGDPGHEKYAGTSARMHIHNAFIEESIRRINELSERPLFTLVLGDYTDHQGEAGHFAVMDRIFQKLQTPVLLEIGNHETQYSAEFTPGYRMAAFDNYFAAQQRLNGLEKLLYSFNIGDHHYIVWPDPLRSNFWETHPHYFDWLARDLERHKDRPTIFFQHVPVHPIGIDPLVHYAEKPYVKKLLLDLLTRHSNVRYVFSGHVHIPLKSSVKTAVSHQGIQFINLPAGGYRPRAFGEEDYFGGPSQGVALVTVDGAEVQVDYLYVTRNRFTYPNAFPEFPLQQASLLTLNKWELAAGTQVKNGGFNSGLDHWHANYVYQEDEHPTYVREIRQIDDGVPALYLRAHRRRYDKPGQDRLPQTLNQLTQVCLAPDGQFPALQLRLKVACATHYGRALTGAFVWLEGYFGHHKRYSLIYSAGRIPASLSNRFDRSDGLVVVHRHLPARLDRWHKVILHPMADLGRLEQPIDRWVLNLGVWNINDGNNAGIEAYFAAIEQGDAAEGPSQLDGKPLEEKPAQQVYQFRVDHTAGEHVIADQDELYFTPPLP